jgi:hypothetical protein
MARLQARPGSRKLLVVVSDGCPMDGATHLAKDAWYRDNHLEQVLQRHERQAPWRWVRWASGWARGRSIRAARCWTWARRPVTRCCATSCSGRRGADGQGVASRPMPWPLLLASL